MSNSSMIDELIASDPEILESFMKESRECLVIAEEDLNCLKEDLGKPDPECIERAFRAVHSLKSAAGFLGLDNVSNLALAMEEMIGNFRGGSITPEISSIELLLEGVEILNVMLANPKDSSDVDTGTFLTKLAQHIAK